MPNRYEGDGEKAFLFIFLSFRCTKTKSTSSLRLPRKKGATAGNPAASNSTANATRRASTATVAATATTA